MKAKPENHLFYRRIKPLLIRYLEQAERENGFIYHQTVADECPALDKTAEFGLARPEEFRLPPFNNVPFSLLIITYFLYIFLIITYLITYVIEFNIVFFL